MNEYMKGLQTQISQSALALSSELVASQKKILKQKDTHMPKVRMPHAYMYNRPLDAADTVSLAYPNLNDGGSTVYYASLTSSVHKLQGTRKRAHMMDDMSSVQMESIADFPQEEEDPEEILRRKRSAAKKFRNNRDRSTTKIEKMQSKVSLGVMNEEEFKAKLGPSAE